MCKAHVLRFRCGHGVLMAIQPCRLGPCPIIKTTGNGLPPQPYRCYNCQHKADQNALRPISSRNSSCASGSSTDGHDSGSSISSTSPRSSAHHMSSISHPLPGVAIQPKGATRIHKPNASIGAKHFSFACKSSDHYPTPHYIDLPSYLPHQDHECPPCQLEGLRITADQDAIRSARAEYPNLSGEMLVHDGRTWDPEIMTKPSLEKYVEEKRTEEREMWFHVTRKWTQDLKKARVLVAEEDGLGLLG